MDEQVRVPLKTIMVVGDSHLSSVNHGYHLDYPNEALYYEEIFNKIAETENVDYYINAGDFVINKEFDLSYRMKVDKILNERKKLLEKRGGRMIYIKGNHDISGKSTTEYNYYVSRGIFEAASSIPVLNIKNSKDEVVLSVNMHDYNDLGPVSIEGKYNILITHGYFVFDYVLEGEDIPNYGDPVRLTEKTDWAGLDYILCGHIHTEHIMRGKIQDKPCTVHYLPCMSRPQYIKKYEEGTEAKREGSIDLIRVYEDDIELERYPIEFLDNKVCFNVERIHSDAAKIEQNLVNKERREALMSMAEELENYEKRETDPVKQVEQLGNVEQKYKDIVYDWFTVARENLKTNKLI